MIFFPSLGSFFKCIFSSLFYKLDVNDLALCGYVFFNPMPVV